jgi:hypothetical protein
MVLSLNGLFSTEFLLSVMVFELYSIAVKFVQKEALVDFLTLYHAVTCCKIEQVQEITSTPSKMKQKNKRL